MSFRGTDMLNGDTFTKSELVQIQDGRAGTLGFSFAFGAQEFIEGWEHTSAG